MLSFIKLLLLVLVHQSLGLDHLDRFRKIHPTWSFELVSVETMIKDALIRLQGADPDVTEAMLRDQIIADLGPGMTHIVKKVDDPKWSKNPPAYFDAREEWKECAELINHVDDEGYCATDSPVVVASVATDRYCIHTNGTSKERLSAEMLMGCAECCTNTPNSYYSFKYMAEHGIPTGGSYKSKEGCLPYEVMPCTHSNQSYVTDARDETRGGRSHFGKLKPCEEHVKYDHECPTECTNRQYKKPLDQDLRKFTLWYTIEGNEFLVRNDIQAYGPMATRILFYDDLLQYPEKGMYRRHSGSRRVQQMKFLKVIGWGEEEETKYWLVMNTWDNWGNTKVFKIPRGVNYVFIEYYMTAGVYGDIH